jgi:hypothetical protein|tara:strand:+ start:917 stop:2206 length:1290 start_codon:yes stop_codon:yes gene_type:complete
MFRYGGPIKEGVMSGIREPKKDGGSMANNEGPSRVALVGNPIYPKGPDGRTNHVVPAVIGAGMGLARLAPLAIRGARALQGLFGSRKFVKDVGTKLAASKNTAPFTPVKQVFEPNKVAKYFIDSPEGRLIAGSTGIAGKIGRGTYKGAKYLASSPLTVGGGLIYVGGKFFKDGKEVPPPPNAAELLEGQGRQFTGDEAMIGDPRKPLPDSKPTLSKEELRKKNVQRYRDIMDIKGMNKTAAYDSLIAASQAINESGDFKKDLKSGSLINKIIQSTSKAFDKPSRTKEAIDTLILKGEIEKDIKASDPNTKLDADYKRAKIAESEAKLNPSFNTLKAGYGKDNKGQSGIDLAAAEYSENTGNTFRGNIITKSDFNEIKADIKEKSGAVDEVTIVTEWTNATIKDKDVPDGTYTVGDKIVKIKDNVVIAVE